MSETPIEHMTISEHRAESAKWLRTADEWAKRGDSDAGQAEHIAIARAQVHATLAVTALAKSRSGRVVGMVVHP